MFILNITIFSLLTITLVIWLNSFVRAKLAQTIAFYQQTKSLEDRLEADYARLEQECACLKRGLAETTELYEITREISKFLEQDKVFAVFNEKIKKFLKLEDCRFLPAQDDLAEFSGWVIISLGIGARSLGSLAVKA